MGEDLDKLKKEKQEAVSKVKELEANALKLEK